MAQPTWAGRILGNRYQLESLLGQGGMSAVYKGTDPNLRRTVAVKLIHSHLAEDEEFVRRFEEEAAAVARLRHSNIIQVYDFNHDEEGINYMVLEYVEGITLEERLKQLKAAGQQMPLTEVQTIMDKLCAAVGYAHEQGMIHRDLKPANVMIRPDGEPMLMDFGIVKIVGGSNNTMTGALMGTVSYMSPEQIKGLPTDQRTDIYALGVMLYEMIAGERPFQGDNSASTMMMHLTEPVPDLREQIDRTEIGNGVDMLAAVIQRAMHKEPADRYQSAAEFNAAIQRYTEQDTTILDNSQLTALLPAQDTIVAASPATLVQTPASKAPSPAATTPPTQRSLAWGGALVLIALIVGGGFWLFGNSGTENPSDPPALVELPAIPTVEPAPTDAPAEPTLTPTSDPSALDPAGDEDGDGLTNETELEIGTDPTNSDTDSDGIPDIAENSVPCLNPINSDTDNDGIGDNEDPDPCGIEATPTPTLSVNLNNVRLENNLYVVDFETTGYEPAPGAPHVHFFFNDVPPEEAGVPGAGPWQIHTNPGQFAVWGPLDKPAEATQLCAIVGNADHTVQVGTEVCIDLPQDVELPEFTVRITNIIEVDDVYEVEFETLGYEPAPGQEHVHFFFDTVDNEEAGIPGLGPWRIHTNPDPFRGIGPDDRPEGATRLCALVGNPDHSVIQNTGNCFTLPGMGGNEYNYDTQTGSLPTFTMTAMAHPFVCRVEA